MLNPLVSKQLNYYSLNKANSYTVNDTQKICLSLYMESFQTGNLRQFREAQKAWVADKAPSVESMLGFIEPGRDPYGVRSEWQGVVCIADAAETRKMREFVHKAPTFATLLPWATAENNGKGPFEKTHLDLPHFTIQHGE
jgi:dipeptidyl-peptidase-3